MGNLFCIKSHSELNDSRSRPKRSLRREQIECDFDEDQIDQLYKKFDIVISFNGKTNGSVNQLVRFRRKRHSLSVQLRPGLRAEVEGVGFRLEDPKAEAGVYPRRFRDAR
jgi:hypothetical protein